MMCYSSATDVTAERNVGSVCEWRGNSIRQRNF
jgi:hypothetical protein